MLIYGHKLIQTPEFHLISAGSTAFASGINCFEFDENLVEGVKKFALDFAIIAKNEDEVLLANALGAKFILIDSEKLLKSKGKNGKKTSANSVKTSANLAQNASKMAEFYLFDSKILLVVKSLKNLRNAYKLGVDGVILKEVLK